MMKFIHVFLLLVLVIVSGVRAQTFGAASPASKDAGAHSPAMHIGHDGTIFVSWFERNADIYFARSIDGGKTFTTPVRASRQVTTNNYTSLLQRAPEFALDTKGVIHLVWTEGRTKDPEGYEQTDVWYIRSTDNGDTWTAPVAIMDAGDSQKFAQDFSAIAIDSSNNLYVSYLDNRYIMLRTGEHYRMHMEKSTDGGTTWSKPVIADKLPIENSGTCECCRQDIAASKDGHIYIAFRTNMTTPSDGDKRDIFICRSWDGGANWDSSMRCQLGDWTLTACPTKGPHIALDANENLHIAWSDARDDSAKLHSYFSLLTRGSDTIFPNYTTNRTIESGNWPDVSVSPTGAIATAYQGDPGSRLIYSSDGGNTWSPSISYPGSDQTLPIIEFDHSGNLYSVWQDGAANGILFAKITGLKPAETPGPIQPLSAPSYPAGKQVRISWSAPIGMRSTPFVWYDFRMGSGATDWGFVTRDTFHVFDSLPAADDYGYVVHAVTTIGSSATSGSFSIGSAAVSASSQEDRSASFFPNPVVNGKLTIMLRDRQNATVTATIVSSAGAEVRRFALKPNAMSAIVLDVSELAAGTYLCELSQGENRWNIRFVK